MNTYTLAPGLEASSLVLGCMRIDELNSKQLDSHINHALDLGINFIDHADIYGLDGHCEELFGDWLRANPSKRDSMYLQTKCGIVVVGDWETIAFDYSYEYIVAQVEKSLRRLNTDHLDVLLLHRPDALYEPEEVARAFDELSASGKVKHFGVSNTNPPQLEYLQSMLHQKLIINQLQFSPAHTGMIDHPIRMNTKLPFSEDHDQGTLDYCRLKGITIQAWSPFQYDAIDGTYMGHPDYAELNQALEEVGEKYGLTKNGAVAAWIARHPAHIQLIAGTTNQQRLSEIAAGMDVRISREDWYKIYITQGRDLP